jgi:uncharacterized small protein (DUF1192 family)
MIDDDELGWTGAKTEATLTTMSVAELQDYVARLEAEIGRAKAVIAAKQSHLDAAQSLFQK